MQWTEHEKKKAHCVSQQHMATEWLYHVTDTHSDIWTMAHLFSLSADGDNSPPGEPARCPHFQWVTIKKCKANSNSIKYLMFNF